jgi:hypothetical protein
MIFEAKANADFSEVGTFRPLGTSQEAWKRMAHLPTVYAAWPDDPEAETVDLYADPDLSGEPVGQASAQRLREDICPLTV